MKKRGILFVMLVAVILIVPLISAGLFENVWDKITGRASSSATVTLNLSVTSGFPVIWNYANATGALTLTDAPNPTYITINFSVYDPAGAKNLNNATAAINLTKTGQYDIPSNSTCVVKDWSSGNYANYTCNVTLWWWDLPGVWTVYANISDLSGTPQTTVNGTNVINVNSLTGFIMTPSALTFSSMSAGSVNQTPTNYLLLNNTGNTNVTNNNVQINATDLVGETDANKFLWASNFSASNSTGGKIECNVTNGAVNATAMTNYTYINVANTTISIGNYTKNDGTGQEQIYLCLRQVGSELSSQAYSTQKFGSWTVKIV